MARVTLPGKTNGPLRAEVADQIIPSLSTSDQA